MAAAPIDWSSAAHAAGEFMSTMLVVGALGAIALLPSPKGARGAAARDAYIRWFAWIGAIASVVESLPYLSALEGTTVEARVRLAAIAMTLGALVTVATRLSADRSAGRRMLLGAAWLGALADLALGLSRAVESGHWRWLLHPLHLLGAGLWIGTLAVLVITFGLRSRHFDSDAGLVAGTFARFAFVAGGSVMVVAITGVASAARRWSFDARSMETTYATVLAVKLALVVCVGTCGAWNWRALRSPSGRASPWPSRVAIAEAGVAALVVVSAAVLVSVRAAR